MDRCFYVPEILRLICEELSGKDLLSAALSCRALLEPGLDKLWQHITSFKPLISCLPDDLWRVEDLAFHAGLGCRSKILFMARIPTPEDLARYITYYAHRIRIIDFQGNIREIFSVEAFQALQLATTWETGALSPRILKLVWSAFSRDGQVAKESSNYIFPYFSMFLGRNVASISFTIRSDSLLHLASIRSVSNLLPGLKELIIEDNSSTPKKVPFIGDVVTSTWNRLELLKASVLTGPAVSLMSSLPRLKTLHVGSLKDIPRITQRGAESSTSPDTPSEGFTSLTSLSLTSEQTFESIIAFLQYIPPTNQIRIFECYGRLMSSNSEHKELFQTIRERLNRQTLQSLKIRDLVFSPGEDLDLDLQHSLDIAPLYSFPKLQHISVGLSQGVWLTPEDTMTIPTIWPTLTKLKLGVQYPDSRIPRINHTHVINILQGCKFLSILGLRFDATQITGEERGTAGAPYPLTHLYVGDSPIYSPNRVAAFLTAHCPRLVHLSYCGDSDRIENGFSTPFEVRWDHVVDRII